VKALMITQAPRSLAGSAGLEANGEFREFGDITFTFSKGFLMQNYHVNKIYIVINK
jgi:hypothetical protein